MQCRPAFALTQPLGDDCHSVAYDPKMPSLPLAATVDVHYQVYDFARFYNHSTRYDLPASPDKESEWETATHIAK